LLFLKYQFFAENQSNIKQKLNFFATAQFEQVFQQLYKLQFAASFIIHNVGHKSRANYSQFYWHFLAVTAIRFWLHSNAFKSISEFQSTHLNLIRHK